MCGRDTDSMTFTLHEIARGEERVSRGDNDIYT